MAYTAKKVEKEVYNSDQYELFTTVTATDTQDKEVTIKKSMGKFSLGTLNSQKENLQAQIAEIDSKISAINALEK